MDVANSQPWNFLYISPENKDDIHEFIQIIVTLLKQNKIVLLFTRQHVDFMSALAGLNKEQLQHFIISYHSDICTIVGKLLQLSDWTILPDFVLLNLNSFFETANGASAEQEEPKLNEVCFCISTLVNYMRFLRTTRCSKSVVLLNAHSNVRIQILIDFYFYKMAAFNVLEEVRNKILEI